jgi:RNA polymerase sigma-70 factor (ECF subfamily)
VSEKTLSVSESSLQRQSYEARDPDVRLMLQVRDDDAAAFEELVLRYQNRLVAVLEHLIGHRELAEDLAQDVFLRVYRSRKTYKATAKFSTWLFTIANNVALNARRSASRRKEVTLDPGNSQDSGAQGLAGMVSVSSGQIPARQLDKAEMRDIVRAAVSSLSDRQRMAVLLNKFEDMSYADIAQVMNMSPQAIKSLLCRARTNLREVIEPYLNEGLLPTGRPLEGDDA